jgi:hypothetical protein
MRSKEPVIPITQITLPRAQSIRFRYLPWLPITAILGYSVFIWLRHWVRRMYRFHSWDW